MTGYGRASGMIGDASVQIELRSLNGKQFDLTMKIPSRYRELESELRKLISNGLIRGKAELYISFDSGEKRTSFNRSLIAAYYRELRELADEIQPEPYPDLFTHVLRMPEVTSFAREEITERDKEALLALTDMAMSDLNEFRTTEGAQLDADLRDRVSSIQQALEEVAARDPVRTEDLRLRLREKIKDLQLEVDTNRFEQELFFYLEKYDINEEKVRLSGHCDHFMDTMQEDGDGQGRKLAFLAQEMGREINTLGSKANDAGIQHIVVTMKDQLEKIKEQVLNVL